MAVWAVEALFFVITAPYLCMLIGMFFQNTSLVIGIMNLIQHLPFVDLFTSVLKFSIEPDAFLDITLLVYADEFLSVLFMGCFFYIFDGFVSLIGVNKLPVIRTVLYFFIVLMGGLVLEGFDAIGGIGAIATELVSIIILMIGLSYLGKSLFSNNPLFGGGNLIKMLLGVTIDSLVAVIVVAYLSLLRICLEKGLGAKSINTKTFFSVMIITVLAVLIDASVKWALHKDRK